MKHERRAVVAAVILSLGAAAGCIPTGKRPFRMVQLCLGDAKGLSDFTMTLKSVARSEGMEFDDRSAQAEQELRAINRANSAFKTSAPTINIGVRDKHGVGLGAGNLGLPGYQVAVGFSEGERPEEASRFADRVVAKLSQQWRVVPVPKGQGAFPLKGCGAASRS